VQYFQGGVHNPVVSFDSTNFDTFKNVQVRAVDDGVIRGFHKPDLNATATGYLTYGSTITISDNHWEGVRVLESNGSTNIVEFTDGGFGPAPAQAPTHGLPSHDYYTLRP